MTGILRPTDTAELVDTVAAALADAAPLAIEGAGSKRGYGRPVEGQRLSLGSFSGVTLYEPDELVLTAGAATPLAEIEAMLAQSRQQLAFEPPDLGPLYGGATDQGTLGGAIACNLAGPRRISAGAARDHFLGFKAVSGRAEAFKAGSRVVKNVTGYDLPKLMAGSFGTLALLTEVTVKVLPRPEKIRTVLIYGLDDAAATVAMAAALQSPHEVSAAAHLPAATAALLDVPYVGTAGTAVTAIRVEGPGPSVEARCLALRSELGAYGAVEELHGSNSSRLWRLLRDAAPLAARPDLVVWRLSVPPASGPAVAAAAGPAGLVWYDWGGGLIWIGLPPGADDGGATRIRAALTPCGGHATLMRAPETLRATVPVFQPPDAAVAALSARVKASFDPKGILNPGRMS